MKKILLLGGSAQQVVAIETAKRLGYYTVLCDYLPDNPGQHYADKFYLVSTTDKDTILDVAQKEKVDGVLAYASDPAAPTAAFVAEKLRLQGNPYESVEILCNKDKFREFLKGNGFCTPKAQGYSNAESAMHGIPKAGFEFPIIVKPVDSSGSKGATVVYDADAIESAVNFAMVFSRSGRIVAEEYVERKHPYLIGGDIFIINGEIVQWGLMNCHRDNSVNPLVPVGKSYPPEINESDLSAVKGVLQKIVTKLKIESGAMNVELIIDKKDRVFPIDIGPRSGGNMIPDLLGYIFDCDVVEMSVQAAMGQRMCYRSREGSPYYATYNLHSAETGTFKDIVFSDEINQYIIKKCIYKHTGDKIEYFDNASKALGIVFMRFCSKDKMSDMISNMNNHIKIITE